MKAKFFRRFGWLALCIFVQSTHAQHSGISLSFFNVALYGQSSPFTQGYMGIGYEKNVGDNISLKFELNRGFQSLYSISKGKILSAFEYNLEKTYTYTDSTNYEREFAYHWTIPIGYEINYQSRFFFAGNDRSGPYLAMGIGVRAVRYVFHVGHIDNYSGSDEVPSDVKAKDKSAENVVIFPLMLRFGVRGELDGFYPDFNFGIGYNLGHNKTFEDPVLTKKYDFDVPELFGISIHAGISFGIGW